MIKAKDFDSPWFLKEKKIRDLDESMIIQNTKIILNKVKKTNLHYYHYLTL